MQEVDVGYLWWRDKVKQFSFIVENSKFKITDSLIYINAHYNESRYHTVLINPNVIKQKVVEKKNGERCQVSMSCDNWFTFDNKPTKDDVLLRLV